MCSHFLQIEKLNNIINFSDATTICDEASKNNNKTRGQGHVSPPSASTNQSSCASSQKDNNNTSGGGSSIEKI
ncbi:hypothetical protein DPMN_045536 [Dreissena polymorpha]|uniref:Uncharacterized protein n=1 Tax=Dreissena polymorpha TaxID=45954 RepID=A0A9D4HZT3_DREPO|nr:hypothetical protein DPMN_045536 [Dreissena polymorpha]